MPFARDTVSLSLYRRHLLARAARISGGVRDVGARDADSEGMLARGRLFRVPVGGCTRTVDRLGAQYRVVHHKGKGVRTGNCAGNVGINRYGTPHIARCRTGNLHGGLHNNR